jgi:hypothetical protein
MTNAPKWSRTNVAMPPAGHNRSSLHPQVMHIGANVKYPADAIFRRFCAVLRLAVEKDVLSLRLVSLSA